MIILQKCNNNIKPISNNAEVIYTGIIENNVYSF